MLSPDILQENCRLCQENRGTITVIDNEEFINKVFEVTKVKINHEQMQLFPKAVCVTCQLRIDKMYCFIQQIQTIDKKLHASIIISMSENEVFNTRKKCTLDKIPKLKVKSKTKDFKCAICSKTFVKYKNLQIHMNTHTKTLINSIKEVAEDSSNIGNNKFSSAVINEDQKYTCTENYSVLNNDVEETGIKSKNENLEVRNLLHNKDKEINSKKNKSIFLCTFGSCTKVCTSTYTLRTHLMKHEGKTPFLCVTCGKGFRTKNSLNCHEKIHAKVKAYVCDVCNIRFSVSSNLRAHQRKHHEGIRYYCSQCPLVYISKYSLERHELVHTGIKEYKCETCKAAFYTNKELMKHQRYHQGLRSYKCEQCFKTFFEKHHLTIHIRGHTGERPYVCKIIGCGKSFTESQKLTRHLKARHPLL